MSITAQAQVSQVSSNPLAARLPFDCIWSVTCGSQRTTCTKPSGVVQIRSWTGRITARHKNVPPPPSVEKGVTGSVGIPSPCVYANASRKLPLSAYQVGSNGVASGLIIAVRVYNEVSTHTRTRSSVGSMWIDGKLPSSEKGDVKPD